MSKRPYRKFETGFKKQFVAHRLKRSNALAHKLICACTQTYLPLRTSLFALAHKLICPCAQARLFVALLQPSGQLKGLRIAQAQTQSPIRSASETCPCPSVLFASHRYNLRGLCTLFRRTIRGRSVHSLFRRTIRGLCTLLRRTLSACRTPEDLVLAALPRT